MKTEAKNDVLFSTWVDQNRAIWDEFCSLADKMRASGRKHYSARAVLHVLRWERALKDASQLVFKINNNWSPKMARLYNESRSTDFFHLRDSPTDY